MMTPRHFHTLATLTPVFIFVLTVLAQAQTALVSLPLRQEVSLHLNPSGPCLVQEKRSLTLKKGVNRVNFSWQNVTIDPATILIEPVNRAEDAADRIRILETRFPPENNALVWHIACKNDSIVPVTVSYLLKNLDSLTAYTGTTDAKETRLQLQTFMVIRNFSGETFRNAAIFLGMQKAADADIRHLETRRLLLTQTSEIPIEKIFTWNTAGLPEDLIKDQTSKGIPVTWNFIHQYGPPEERHPLHSGKARLFQKDAQNGTVFLGEDTLARTPWGDKALLHVGDSRDVVVSRRVLESKKINIRKNSKNRLQAYDEIVKVSLVVENTKQEPARLKIIETIPGYWEPLGFSMPHTLQDHQTLVFVVPLDAGQKKILTLNYKKLNVFSAAFSRYNQAVN